jgi:hypothetical protein
MIYEAEIWTISGKETTMHRRQAVVASPLLLP